VKENEMPEQIKWEKGAEEYILIVDLGDIIALGIFRWCKTHLTYELVDVVEIPDPYTQPLTSPTYQRQDIH
jgi:hypothetical protein